MIKNILITGCTGGLGNALAKHFANLNLQVFAVGRNSKPLQDLVSTSDNIHPIFADISTEKGRKDVVESVKFLESVSIIHNAAIAEPCMFSSLDESLLRQHIEINYLSPAIITQKLLSQLKNQRVLHISSGAASLALPGLMPYCITKAALEHMTSCLNTELNASGVYFANLRPGMIDTPMESKFRESLATSLPQKDFYIRVEKEKKLIAPQTVAEFIAWVVLKTNDQIFSTTLWNIYDERYQLEWLNDLKFKPIPPS